MILKLKLYNIDTSQFSSYLSNQCQQTHYSGAISDKRELISGVSQCSVLGPIICLIYVNDLPLLLTETSADILADNITIAAVNHSKEDLVHCP